MEGAPSRRARLVSEAARAFAGWCRSLLRSRLVRRLLACLAILGIVASCGPATSSGALVTNVSAGPPLPSPDLPDVQNHLDVRYTLTAPAQVTAQIKSTAGQVWTVYQDQPRPTAGSYTLSLDGTVAGQPGGDRRVLADGSYQVALTAQADGRQQEVDVPMTIQDADTDPPQITGLALDPTTITPNFGGVDDVTQVTFDLSKAAQVGFYADFLGTDGTRTRVWQLAPVAMDAGSQQTQWDGTSNSLAVADGSYMFGIQAQDEAGNVTVTEAPLTVQQSGYPDARIVASSIGPREVQRGGQVCADVTVQNVGETVLRTEGPDPGYVYDSRDSFGSIDDHAYPEQEGLWRVGLDATGSSDPTQARYPYRWGFGQDLQPGDEATVHGCVVVESPDKVLYFYAGIVQEAVAIRDGGAGLIDVTITG